MVFLRLLGLPHVSFILWIRFISSPLMPRCDGTRNPFHCDSQLLPFLQFLNSTEELIQMKTFAPFLIMVPRKPAFLSAALIPADVPVPMITSYLRTAAPLDSQICRLFFMEEHNSTVLKIFLPRSNKEVPFVIEAEIEGLNLSNNKLQSLEEARLPNRMRFLFLDHNLIRKPPVSLLESLEFLTSVTLSNNPWACDCDALDFKKWVVLKSVLVLDVKETRCGPDMPDRPGLAERSIWLLTGFGTLPRQHSYLHLHGFRISQFVLIDDQLKNRLDTVRDRREGVALLTRSDLGQGKDIDRDKEFDAFISFSHKDQDLVIQGANRGDRREGPGYQVVPSLQTLPPGRIHTKEHHEGREVLQENSPRALSALKDHVPRIIVIKLPDQPQDDELPEEIQLYLSNTTYLTWGEKHFWSKLLYMLPRSQSIQKHQFRNYTRLPICIANRSV
ncbi:protein toll [Caerostris extrusa]|uniref:Protein toll n=1 Tax=Caerostris extrusa TaxID=172846 RepID=A0AAV4Y730_CAEEX|nr:protein toll [Caerostris extrusa]